jgi:hypothetical protein
MAIQATLERCKRSLRARGDSGDGMALVSVLLFMILLSSMSLVLLSVILSQLGPSYIAQKSTKTVYAAQGGLQAGLATLRSALSTTAISGEYFGDPAQLPCSFSGNLDGSTSDLSYTVTIQYFTVDPTGMSDSDLNSKDLNCTASGGVAGKPTFAYLVSEGKGVSAAGRSATEANRKVAAVYKFKIRNVNIPGGRIYSDARTFCMAAETITVGANVRFVAAAQCTEANISKQNWIYDTSYQIKLASTTVGDPAIASGRQLCVTGSGTANATLTVCQTNSSRWNQLWSWNDNGQWQGQQNPIALGPSGTCLVKSTTYLRSQGCSGALDPDPSVGAGAAGYATTQIVNYKEFGRCADVTDLDPAKTYMIVYPCKQDPTGTGANLAWNHKWYYSEPVATVPPAALAAPVTAQVYVMAYNTSKRCLQIPSVGSASTDVNFTTACSSTENRQKWTRTTASTSRLDSYTFKDYLGRCLTADTVNPHLGAGNIPYSVMRMAACDGSGAQKWNAPSTFSEAEFEGFKELG